MIANYLQTNVSVNCLQKVSKRTFNSVGELSPKTVSLSCLVDELSPFHFYSNLTFWNFYQRQSMLICFGDFQSFILHDNIVKISDNSNKRNLLKA